MIKKPLDKTTTSRRNKDSAVVTNPELVFGIVGPIGVDVEAVMDALTEALKDVGTLRCRSTSRNSSATSASR